MAGNVTVYEREVEVYERHCECRTIEQLAELVRQGWRADVVKWSDSRHYDFDVVIVSKPFDEGDTA
jgi:hypothetical protein